jgi:ribose transport system substrate-binding protein
MIVPRMRRALTALAIAVAGIALLAGCGSSSSSSSSTSSAAGSTASSAGGGGSGAAAEAKQLIAKYEDVEKLTWPKPTQPFKPGAGKVAVISCGQAGIDCKRGAEFVDEAAKAMGWTASPTFNGEFLPAKQGGYVQQAVQEGYNAIVLVAIDPQTIKAAVDAAAAKKIPISCMECVNEGFGEKVINVTSGGAYEGRALGDWIITDTNGKAKVLQFDDKTFAIIGARQKGAKEEIKRLCPSCSVEEADIPTSDLTKPNAPTYTAALASHPPGSLTTIMTPSDPEGLPLVKLATQDGRTDFKITGYDASSPFVEDIAQGQTLAAATTAVSFQYVGWAAMDEVARIHAGSPAWDATTIPAILITKNNAEKYKSGFYTPAFDFKGMFKQQWGR